MRQNSPTIVIVGGVAGGASAAARARRCNEHARIIMFEKDDHVSFANCGLPYYIGGEITERDKLLLATPQRFKERFGIDVRTRHEVVGIDRRARSVTVRHRETGETTEQFYDRLILSPGATPIVPPLDGIDSTNVFSLRNLGDTDRIKAFLSRSDIKKVVVVGAGFIGLEMVEMFHHLDMDVALVELQSQVLPPLDPEMAHIVQSELEQRGVSLHLAMGWPASGSMGLEQRMYYSTAAQRWTRTWSLWPSVCVPTPALLKRQVSHLARQAALPSMNGCRQATQ